MFPFILLVNKNLTVVSLYLRALECTALNQIFLEEKSMLWMIHLPNENSGQKRKNKSLQNDDQHFQQRYAGG